MLKIKIAGCFGSELQPITLVHEKRWQLFARFQLSPRGRTQTPTEPVSEKTSHKLIVLTTSPDFVLTFVIRIICIFC